MLKYCDSIQNQFVQENVENQNQSKPVSEVLFQAVNDAKAQKVVTLDVSHLTSVTDHMIICNGTSSRHMRHLADEAAKAVQDAGHEVLSTEGLDSNEWMIVDCGDAVLHVMSADAREFYHLEGLWDLKATAEE